MNSVGAFAAAAVLTTAVSVAGAERMQRPWTPADSVTCEYVAQNLGSITTYYNPTAETRRFYYAPDGSRAIFATWRGRLETDENEVSLHCVFTPALGQRMRNGTKIVLTGNSPFSQTVVYDIEWQDEGATLWFKKADLHFTELWRWDTDTSEPTLVRRWTGRIRPVILHAKGTVVFQETVPQQLRHPAYPVGLAEVQRETPLERRKRIYGAVVVEQVGKAPWRIPTEEGIRLVAGRMVSPGEDRILVIQERDGKRPTWALLDLVNRLIEPIATIEGLASGSMPLYGAMVAPGDSVVLSSARPLWLDSGNTSSVWIYNFKAKAGTNIIPAANQAARVGVLSDANSISLSVVGKDSPPTNWTLTWSGIEWKRDDSNLHRSNRDSGALVVVSNSPEWPRVLTRDANGYGEIIQTNRQSSLLRRVVSIEISWSNADGSVSRAGLLLPPDAGSRSIPLVIQNYGYFPDEFLPDGPNVGSCDAAQPLLSCGIAVLQIDSWANRADAGKAGEGAQYCTRVERAVAAAKAAVPTLDLGRVGVSGFSRAGYLSLYLATHPPSFGLKAVVLDDSYSGSYSGYLASGTGPMSLLTEPQMYEGHFWENKDAWLREETSFNFDRISTPLLITNKLYGGSDVRSPDIEANWLQNQWPIALMRGGLTLAKRPHEFVVFPTGAHQLQRPRERFALLNMVTDWFAFWLTDTEDSDPAKARQYIRWRRLRAMIREHRGAPPGGT